MQDADARLQSMANHNDNEWPFAPTETEPSPITSLATDTRTTQRQIYKGCKCPDHQEIYSDWPIQDARTNNRKMYEDMHVLRQVRLVIKRHCANT